MKRLFVLLVLVMVPLFAGTVTRTAQFDQNDLVITSQDGFDNVELRDGAALIQPGSPRVPRLVEAVVIPSGAVPVRVTVTAEEWVTLPGTYNVGPAQPDFPLPQPGKTRTPTLYPPDPAIYGSSEAYPQTVAMLTGSGTWAGYRIAHVELHPVRYVPTTHQLQVATRLSYRLEYANGLTAAVATNEQKSMFGDMVRSMVVNPEDVNRCAPRVRATTSLTLPAGHYEYVVITDSVMDTVFARLADWKTQKGVPGTVVRTSYIYANYTGYDEQEKIRNFIKDAYATWGTMYVLLGGQGDYQSSGQNIIPTRMGNCGEGDEPCDLYYAGLDGTWDFNNNHTYGEISDSTDMCSDVFVGRAPTYNVAMAQNFVSKTIKYEQNPPSGFIEKMTLPTGILWSSYEERPGQESICRMTPPDWSDQKLYERTGNLGHQIVMDSMNAGVGMGHWMGHGNESGIYMGGGSQPFFESTDADALTNGDKTGFAISIACDCAAWDWVSGGDCLAEHMVNRVGGGCIATMMNTRYGYGAIGQGGEYVFGPSERLDTTFFSGIFYSHAPHIGLAFGRCKAVWSPYADSMYQYDEQRYCIYDLNLIGDPETPAWTAEPTPLNVSHADVINIGNNVPFQVTVATGLDAPVESAMVYLKKGEEVDMKGWTDATGQLTLYVSCLTPGQMLMTVNAHDHYIYQDTVMVIASSRYVSYLRSSIDDPSPGGNGDGAINPGESFHIPTWVKNYGQQTATGVMGRLGTADTAATISDSIISFGTVPAGDSAQNVTGFGMSVADGLPDGYPIPCTLVCWDDNDSTWVSRVTFHVGAPELVYSGWQVIDTLPGGNRNHRLDPQEPGLVVITLGDTGFGNAKNITGVLTSYDTLLVIDDSVATFNDIVSGGTGDNSADPFVVHTLLMAPERALPCTVRVTCAGRTWHFGFVIKGEMNEFDPVPDGPREPAANWAYDDVDSIYSQRPTFNWFEINTRGAPLYLTNDSSDFIQLPFTWQVYGHAEDYITICSNGWVAPGNQSSIDTPNNTPLPGGPVQGMVAVNWDDLNPEAGGAIYVYHDAVRHRYIVEWDSVPYTATPSVREKFQVMIYDGTVPTPTGDNVIVMQYLTDFGYGSSTIGVQNMAKDVGINCLCNGEYHRSAVPIAANRAIKYTSGLSVAVAEPAGVTNLTGRPLAVSPNPFNASLQVNWQMKREGNAELAVYDVGGRVVRTLVSGSRSAGSYTSVWNGTDNAGRRLARGIYFVRLSTADQTVKVKTVLAR